MARPLAHPAARRRGRAAAAAGALALLALLLLLPRRPGAPARAFGSSVPADADDDAALPGFDPAGRRRATAPPPPSAAASCAASFPWIRPAVTKFMAPARASAAESLQSSAQSLAAMDEVTWVEGYHPGHDRVTLRYDPALGRYNLTSDTRSPHNRQYKRDCMLGVLAAAVASHGGALAAALRRRDLAFVFNTEDFGMTWRGQRSKLPSFSMCTDPDHVDIPVPDFTYGCYPETRYTNSSWPAVAALLAAKGSMVAWRDRRQELFHRSNWGVGPRQGLMPLLQALHANGSDAGLLGAAVDVGDTGFIGANNAQHFVFLDAQCDHAFHIHTAGFSYSAALKYKLACGAVVFKFASKYVEFYEPGLRDGVHVVELPAQEHGVDEDEFLASSGGSSVLHGAARMGCLAWGRCLGRGSRGAPAFASLLRVFTRPVSALDSIP
jgi:hypothetical protein